MVLAGESVRRLRGAIGIQIASQICKLLVAIGLGGWMARYLGPTAFGSFNFIFATVSILAPLGSLGIKNALAGLLAEARSSHGHAMNGLLSSALIIEVSGTLLLSLCLLPWLLTSRNMTTNGLLVCAIAINFFNSGEVFEAYLFNQHRGALVGLSQLVQVLLGAALTIAALITRAPLVAFGVILAIQAAIYALALWTCVYCSCASSNKSLYINKWQTIQSLLSRGSPFVLSGLSVMVYMKSDLIMLEWLRSSREVGYYSVAVKASECLYFLPVILANNFLPRLKRFASYQLDCVLANLKRFYKFSWLLGVCMVAVTMLFMPVLIPPIFGPQFSPALPALLALGPAAFAVSTGCASTTWMNVNGYGRIIAIQSVFGAISNIVLNLLLIPGFGIVGAAISTSLSYLMSVFVIGFCFRDIRTNILMLAFPW